MYSDKDIKIAGDKPSRDVILNKQKQIKKDGPSKELSQKALLCLHQLEEPYKEVFLLSVFGGFSLKDISFIFKKSESWARVTFYRAKQKLLEKMR